MSGLTHTVRVVSVTDVGNATQYCGTITYPMSVVVDFVAVNAVMSLDSNEDYWCVVDGEGEAVNGSTEANIIRHIRHINTRAA